MHALRLSMVGSLALLLLTGSTIGLAGQDEDAAARPPIPSSGCGTSTVETGLHLIERIPVDGVERKYTLYVPTTHDEETPLPLWVQLHGCCGDSAITHIANLRGTADEHGFVVLAPHAELERDGWAWRADDQAVDLTRSNPGIFFIDTLIDHAAGELCIDLARVFAAGFSFGGEGASVLGCSIEDRIAAVAAVSGTLDLGAACVVERPVPLIAIHGTADPEALFAGGWGDFLASINDQPVRQAHAQASIPDRVTEVAVRNGCVPDPTSVPIDEHADRLTWDCPHGAEVELVVHGGSHRWSVGRSDSDINDLIWAFFAQHPLPEEWVPAE
jgi:polyhydroxybutyrate depolymerase